MLNWWSETSDIQQCCNRDSHAGFVHIVLGVYQCFCRDLTFLLLAQIFKVHECCTASDLNVILWMMTSSSLVSSGVIIVKEPEVVDALQLFHVIS